MSNRVLGVCLGVLVAAVISVAAVVIAESERRDDPVDETERPSATKRSKRLA